MTRTRAYLLRVFPANLALCIYAYFRADGYTPLAFAMAGNYERCLYLGPSAMNHVLIGACISNYPMIVRIAIMGGADDWNHALVTAASYGHVQMVCWMIRCGADARDEGLVTACRHGREVIAWMMIARGARAISEGARQASMAGFLSLAQRMYEYDAIVSSSRHRDAAESNIDANE